MSEKITLQGILFDEKSSYLKGPALAPPLIRKAYHNESANYFTENGKEISKETKANFNLDNNLIERIQKWSDQKFEENKREIKSSQLVKLAFALGTSISEIFSTTNFNDKDYTFKNIEFREKSNLYNVEEFKNKITANLYVEYSAYEVLEQLFNDKIKFRNPIENNEISSFQEVEEIVFKLRKKWKFGTTPIYDLIGFLEDLGIKIFEVDREEGFVGFSCWMKKTPVIVVNTRNKDIPRRRFTVLHELSHLLLKFSPSISEKAVERFCDQFAGAMLLPEEALKEYFNDFIIKDGDIYKFIEILMTKIINKNVF